MQELDSAVLPGASGWDAELHREPANGVRGHRGRLRSLQEELARISSVRNQVAHHRDDPARRPERAEELRDALELVLAANPIFAQDVIVPRRVEIASSGRCQFHAWLLRGPAPVPHANGVRLQAPVSADVRPDRAYLVEATGDLVPLHPFVVIGLDSTRPVSYVLDRLDARPQVSRLSNGAKAPSARLELDFDDRLPGWRDIPRTPEQLLAAARLDRGDGGSVSTAGAPQVPRVGDSVAGLRLVELIGTGSTSTVFRAEEGSSGGQLGAIAVKVLRPGLREDPWYRTRFEDEAEIGRKLVHRNVARVAAHLEAGVCSLLVMEYVDGCSLATIRNFDLAPETSVAIVCQVLRGLDAAHRAADEQGPLGIVHRSLGPEEVLVSRAGVAKIIDFGFATHDGQIVNEPTVKIAGRLPYMSPEQVCGDQLDARSDLYAAGLILWELLARRLAFPRPGATPNAAALKSLVALLRSPKLRPPSEYSVGIPPALDEAVMWALAPDRQQRARDAATLADALLSACPGARRVSESALGAIADQVGRRTR